MGKFATHYQTSTKNGLRRSHAAFTLVEMLAVVGIILIMLGMTLPAINDVLGSKGRKGAVNILLNTFEQARVAALEQSTNVYVGFADRNITSSLTTNTSIKPYTSFIVFRDRVDDIDGATAPKYIALSKWQSLPKGISFKSGKSTIVDGVNSNTLPISTNDKFPAITAQDYAMPVLKFNSTGVIETPSSGNLWVFIYEGFYGGSDVFTRASGQGESSGLFERISFARYTGRAQLDITTI